MIRLARFSAGKTVWIILILFVVSCYFQSPVGAEELDLLKPDCSQQPPAIPQFRRPGHKRRIRYEQPTCHQNAVPAVPDQLLNDPIARPDRWRIVESLGYKTDFWNPYSGHNPIKGDLPIYGNDWFVNLTATSDTVLEQRHLPQAPTATGSISGGNNDQFLFNQNLIGDLVLYKGDTVFKPPDYEFRIAAIINYREAHTASEDSRQRGFLAVQSLYSGLYLRTVSDRYDFDSIRIGIQPFSSDFRGFLFQDWPLGVRLYGSRDNNIFQYNLAWFRRMSKDPDSRLNDLGHSLRDDDVFLANLYWQDLGYLGITSQFVAIYNRNKEDPAIDDRKALLSSSKQVLSGGYDSFYVGYNADGHWQRLNLSGSLYYVFGEIKRVGLLQRRSDINAWFAALEASMDFNWVRLKLSVLHGSGDDDPDDRRAEGFDAIQDNPLFAGADTSYWTRQALPLSQRSQLTLSGRNSVLGGFRNANEQRRSDFSNPGITLIGLGADLDLTPKLRWSINVNHLWFDQTEPLEKLYNQQGMKSAIGFDVSTAFIYRPFANQNIILRLSSAVLAPGDGLREVYGNKLLYSFLGNLVLTY